MRRSFILATTYFVLSVTAQTAYAQPTRSQAIQCVTNFINHIERTGQDPRALATSLIDRESVATWVMKHTGWSQAKALQRVEQEITGRRSSAFAKMDYGSIVYLRSSRPTKGPLTTRSETDWIYELVGYYYRSDTPINQRGASDRQKFTLWIRIRFPLCQIADVAWNNARLSWAAANLK